MGIILGGEEMGKVNQEERAYRAWPILTQRAREGRPITYGDLGLRIGVHHRALRFVLGVIQDYCQQEHLPPLTIIVVRKGKSMPGKGFIAWDVDDLKGGEKYVYNFDWKNISNPFEYTTSGNSSDALAKRLVAAPRDAGAVYALVKVRGAVQQIFRKALLLAYEHKCGICGFSFGEALEAAHWIDWPSASPHERASVSNGILLCSTHHRLFDAGYITVTPSGRIEFFDPACADGIYTSADKNFTVRLHGKNAFLPRSKDLWPSEKAQAYRYSKHAWKNLK